MVDRVGQKLGNYRLTQLLGQGGFADVYLGEHIFLKTQAAIKVLQMRLANDDMESFVNEARTIAGLKHSHIVRVLDFGVDDSTPFLVMDYAPLGTLRQQHPRGTLLPVATIVSYVKQVAAALQYAHNKKLIHRDIKPENMLLESEGEILLSDFGIATAAQSSRYQSTQEAIGTLAYMSPEQLQGKPRISSDQYSLGIVVYEWLSGDRPFHGSFIEMASQHMLVAPPPLREKVPDILSPIEEVVMVALSKDPQQRFVSVQAFANALEQASRPGQTQFAVPDNQSLLPTIIVNQPLAPTVAVNPKSQSFAPTVAVNPSSQPLVPTILTPPPTSPLPPKVLVTPRYPRRSLRHNRRASPLPPTALVTPAGKAPGPPGTTLCTYRGHSNLVNALAWSPDGTRIASGSADSTVQIWNTATGRKLYSYEGHTQEVSTVAWSPDGKLIASAGEGKTVQIWEAATGRDIFAYFGHTQAVNMAAWSPDGKLIASAGNDRKVDVWEAINGRKIASYAGHSRRVNVVAWSPDGRRIVSGASDSTAQIWDAYTGHRIFTHFGHAGLIRALAWSADGKHIASDGDDQIVRIWEIATGRTIVVYDNHANWISGIAWSPNGKYIASASADKTVQIWDAVSGHYIHTYQGHTEVVLSVAWSPDGTHIASASDDDTVQVWQIP